MPNRVIKTIEFPTGQRLEIVQGDLILEPVEAIVNAANSQLLHGGGVAGVISRSCGPVLNQESREWVRLHGPVPHDKPAYTSAGRLPFRYIIHAVGPVWGEGDEDAHLASAVRGSLERAEELGLGSLAMPAISTGIFGFPKQRAANVILQAIARYFADRPRSSLNLVRITLIDQDTLAAFLEEK
ncbi:MAG TPA: macro domain-containing protein [Anaerolineaceae bacterium]